MSNLSIAAASALRSVVEQGASLDQALVQTRLQGTATHAAHKALTYGACREYVFIDTLLNTLIEQPIRDKDRLLHFLLAVGIYQLDYMRRPEHAVVNECVTATKSSPRRWASGLVNGVLRRYLREREQLVQEIGRSEAAYHRFPQYFIDRFKSDWPKYWDAMLAASNQPPPLTLRVNLRVNDRSGYVSVLDEKGIAYKLCASSDFGITLINPVEVENIPGFQEGRVSVQDESAQLITLGLDVQPGHRVLDACAAPGGKSCLLLEQADAPMSLVAVDLPVRTSRIHENLRRLSLQAEVVNMPLQDYAEQAESECFDRILLDVPCSGSGVIRRHPEIRFRRSGSDIEQFAMQQQQLLLAAWKLLKPGGLLLYVTCSVFKEENDDVVEKFLAMRNDISCAELDSGLGVGTKFGRQRLPGIHSGDGFFYCALTRQTARESANVP